MYTNITATHGNPYYTLVCSAMLMLYGTILDPYINSYVTVRCPTIRYDRTVHYNILYYTILYYTILYYTILYYTILYYTILYYTILYYYTALLDYTILLSPLRYCVPCCTIRCIYYLSCKLYPMLDVQQLLHTIPYNFMPDRTALLYDTIPYHVMRFYAIHFFAFKSHMILQIISYQQKDICIAAEYPAILHYHTLPSQQKRKKHCTS